MKVRKIKIQASTKPKNWEKLLCCGSAAPFWICWGIQMHLEQFGSCISLMSSYFLISRLPVDFVGPATLILWLFEILLAQLLAFCGFVDPSKSFQGIVAPPNSLFSYFAASQQHSKSFSCHFLAQRPRQDLIFTIQLLHGPLLVPFAAPPRTFSRDFKAPRSLKSIFWLCGLSHSNFAALRSNFWHFTALRDLQNPFLAILRLCNLPKNSFYGYFMDQWPFYGPFFCIW